MASFFFVLGCSLSSFSGLLGFSVQRRGCTSEGRDNPGSNNCAPETLASDMLSEDHSSFTRLMMLSKMRPDYFYPSPAWHLEVVVLSSCSSS